MYELLVSAFLLTSSPCNSAGKVFLLLKNNKETLYPHPTPMSDVKDVLTRSLPPSSVIEAKHDEIYLFLMPLSKFYLGINL